MKRLNFKEKWAHKAKSYDDLFILSLIGALCGLVCGLVMALFYAVIYLPERYFIGVDVDSFASLPVELRVAIPIAACSILALIFSGLPKKLIKVGVPYVVERLNYHQGNLPVGNAIVQFFTAAIGLAGGLSIGKEGPAVHLGATVGGYLSQKFKLPQYGVETLLACGAAGAIAAVFQTPLAGGLFAFEVIFLEYRQRYVLPVLLSSVTAMLVSSYLLGPLEIFSVGELPLTFFTTDLFVACFSLVVLVVLLVVLFFHIQKWLWRFNEVSVWIRFSLVALATSLAAIYIPEALGSGFHSLTGLLAGDLVVYSLLFLIFAKTVLTAFTIGLGIPGGMIGPTFIIGGMAGVQVALLFGSDFNESEIVLFALLGMAAMMAAAFQAPLAALVAIVEMTHSSEVIVPALFVIVLSCLLMRVLFHQESIFVERLSYMGMTSSLSPFQRYLRHHTVTPVAEIVLPIASKVPLEQIKDLSSSMVDYVVFEFENHWHIVRRAQVVEALYQLDLGPQAWLISTEANVLMDLPLAVQSSVLPLIDKPASLEGMLEWFQKTGEPEVLVRFPDSTFSLVSHQNLNRFLLQDD